MEVKYFPTIDLEATGRHILELRKKKGLSVKDMQSYFGFEAPQAIYKWQSGVTLPTVDNLLALSALLEVPMESILVTGRAKTALLNDEPAGSVFLPFFPERHKKNPGIQPGFSLSFLWT